MPWESVRRVDFGVQLEEVPFTVNMTLLNLPLFAKNTVTKYSRRKKLSFKTYGNAEFSVERDPVVSRMGGLNTC